MTERTFPSSIQASSLNRRWVLRRGGLAAGAAALLAAPIAGRGAAAATGDLVYDVALDGGSARIVRADRSDPNAMPAAGDTFIMNGAIFPAGTFDRGELEPDQPGAIGRWICRGSFNVDLASGLVPHAVTTVLHILDDGLSVADGKVAAAPDAIVHEGLEGGVPVMRRAVVGGYGAYAGARGETVQTLRGENGTLIRLTPEIAVPAPSYTFAFTLTQ